MSSPKISVIIPNYNHSNYLRQRIETVLNQTYKNFEVIILDDCSTDDSRLIIDSYRSHPAITHIIFNSVNSGSPFRQWKKGIERTQGEWIWIAESDDYADERFLELMLKATPPDDRVGLVYCDSKIVSDQKVETDTFATFKNERFKTTRWSHNYYQDGIKEIEEYLLPGGTINNTSAVLFRKRVLLESNPFDQLFRYIGDKYAFIRVLAISDVAYVSDALNYYRDPFNAKHADRYVFYFYEQFMVFNWVYRNVKVTNWSKFWEGFYSNTRNSIYRDWNKEKIALYRKLLALNSSLLIKSILRNLWQPLKDNLSV